MHLKMLHQTALRYQVIYLDLDIWIWILLAVLESSSRSVLLCSFGNYGDKELEIIRALTFKSKFGQKFVETLHFAVKVLITLNSLNHRNFQTKTNMKVKVCFYAKLCAQKSF